MRPGSRFCSSGASVFSPGKRRRGLRIFLFILPIIQAANHAVEVHTYTVCPCLQCMFSSWSAYETFVRTLYVFSIARLVVFPLCTSSPRDAAPYTPRCRCGPTLVILIGFGGFSAALACMVRRGHQ